MVMAGCFYGNKDMFRVSPPLDLIKLLVPFRVEAIFHHKVKSVEAQFNRL